MTVGRGASLHLSEADTARRIKQWCVEGGLGETSDRQGHMKLHRRPLESADELFDDVTLNNMRREFWDDEPLLAGV